MRVAITGASGLVGGALTRSLVADGHTVVRLVRRAPRSADQPGIEEAEWRAVQGRVDTTALHGTDAVVHLAGAPLGPGLWSQRRRTLIRRSRVHGTRALARALAAMDSPPPRLLTASGMHYYGDTGGTVATEETPPGKGFLAEVAQAWEEAAQPARDAGLSVAHMRTAVVLDGSGGLLRTVLPLYRAGLGGRLGSGAQYMSWISLHDHVRAIRFLLERPDIVGPVNMCAPEAVSNAAFSQALGRALGTPMVVPIPATALRATLGDVAEETALVDLRAAPERLLRAGYSFDLPTIDGALSDILGRPVPPAEA